MILAERLHGRRKKRSHFDNALAELNLFLKTGRTKKTGRQNLPVLNFFCDLNCYDFVAD